MRMQMLEVKELGEGGYLHRAKVSALREKFEK